MSDFDKNLLSNTLDRLLEAGYDFNTIEQEAINWLRSNRPVAPGAGGPVMASIYPDPDPKSFYENVIQGGDW